MTNPARPPCPPHLEAAALGCRRPRPGCQCVSVCPAHVALAKLFVFSETYVPDRTANGMTIKDLYWELVMFAQSSGTNVCRRVPHAALKIALANYERIPGTTRVRIALCT